VTRAYPQRLLNKVSAVRGEDKARLPICDARSLEFSPHRGKHGQGKMGLSRQIS
jgi:hypothetical protein